MTDTNETGPRSSSISKTKVTTASKIASSGITSTTTTTSALVGAGANYKHLSSKSGSNSSLSSPASPSSSSQRRKKHREDPDSGGIRPFSDKDLVSHNPGFIPPSYQYQTHDPYHKSSSSSISSGHRHTVTSDADFPDGKASSNLHHGKKHGRASSSHHQHHSSSRNRSALTGDPGNTVASGIELKDEMASTSDVQEAIRNLLTSVDTASSASSASSSPPKSSHHPHRHRSSSSSPPRYPSPHAPATSSTGGTPKISNKKILPPSPIVVDSPARTPRRKHDVPTLSSSPGSMGAKSAPTHSSSPPPVPPHASSCPSPPPVGRYSGASGSPGPLSSKKDDIVLPPTRSTAPTRTRTCQNTTAITTVASSMVSTTSTYTRPGPISTKLHSPPEVPPHRTGYISSKSSRSGHKDKSMDSSFDSDSGGIPNFYKTNQKLAEMTDARPKYKTSSGNSSNVTAGYSSSGYKSGYGSTGSNKSGYGSTGSNKSGKSKKSSHHHSQGGSRAPGDVGPHSSNKNSNYNRGYRSLEKENTSSYGDYRSLEKDNPGSYGGYVTGYSNTIGSCGLGVDQNINNSQEKIEQHNTLSVEGKTNNRSSKIDHVYYTADRPSRRNLPTTGGNMGHHHRASSVPARRSMSVSEFAGTSVDPEPGNGQNEGENLEKVKSKLMSMWNNVKYGWTLNRKTSFRYDSPIFLLGEHYHRRHDDESDGKIKEETRNCVNSMELFKIDFASRLWFTYRKDFEPLKGTKLTTDCGWGCMIRSGQMMLAQAFITHFFGRSWRIHNRDRGLNVYRQIIKWFADYQQCPFSVHQLVEVGSTLGRKPGEWYGPATVATMLREAMERSYEFQPVLRELCVYVASDCTVYLQEVADLCMSGNNNTLVKMPNGDETEDAAATTTTVDATEEMPESDKNGSWKRAVIVLIPLRLGGESLNSVYIPCLQNLLAEEHCIGIIGGKPKHSLYFVGWQDKKLIYLDPHYCQDNVDVMSGDFTFSSYHCITPRKLPFEDMDPSCTIGFYCRNQEEFEKFVNQTRDLATNPKQKGLYPAFAFVDGRSCDLQMDKLELNKERYLRIRYVDQDGKQKLPANENDDFVVL